MKVPTQNLPEDTGEKQEKTSVKTADVSVEIRT
jgi:hypothetical protein